MMPLQDVIGYQIRKSVVLGKGSFGTVYLAKKGISRYAVKCINFVQHPKVASKEVTQKLRLGNYHKNIIKVYDIKKSADSMYIFMDFCEFRDLNKYFKKQNPGIEVRANIMLQTAEAIEYMHNTCKVVHRDLKPGNILVKEKIRNIPVIKVSDFGLAYYAETGRSSMHSNVGTKAFKAPEFWNPADDSGRISYKKSVDIFAFGLTGLAILQAKKGKKNNLVPKVEGSSISKNEKKKNIGEVMFYRQCYNQPTLSVTNCNDHNDHPIKKGINTLILKMTDIDPRRRPGASDVVDTIGNLLADNEEESDSESAIETASDVGETLERYDRYLPHVNRGKIWKRKLHLEFFSFINPRMSSMKLSTQNHENRRYLLCRGQSEKGEVIRRINHYGTTLDEHDSKAILLSKYSNFCSIPGTELITESCSNAGTIWVYDFSKGSPSRYAKAFNWSAKCLCEGPDGCVFAYIARKKQILQLRWNEGRKCLEEVRQVAESEPINKMCYDPQKYLLYLLTDTSVCCVHAMSESTLLSQIILWEKLKTRNFSICSMDIDTQSGKLFVADNVNSFIAYFDPLMGSTKCQQIPVDICEKDVWDIACSRMSDTPYIFITFGKDSEKLHSYKIT